MRVIAVGTGTVVPEADRGCSCFYVEMKTARALLDCGPGSVQGLARHDVPWPDLTDLVITHFHTDHVGAIPGLLFSLQHGVAGSRSRPLDVWGPPGTSRLFHHLAEALGEHLSEPGFPLRIHEAEPPGEVETPSGLRLQVCATPHTDESRAVRLRSGARSVAYTGDTGLLPGTVDTLGGFLRGVDLLIAECSLSEAQVGDNHLSPSRLARLAEEARPNMLWVTHVYPHFRGEADVIEEIRAAGYGGSVALVRDGDVWTPPR